MKKILLASMFLCAIACAGDRDVIVDIPINYYLVNSVVSDDKMMATFEELRDGGIKDYVVIVIPTNGWDASTYANDRKQVIRFRKPSLPVVTPLVPLPTDNIQRITPPDVGTVRYPGNITSPVSKDEIERKKREVKPNAPKPPAKKPENQSSIFSDTATAAAISAAL